MFLSTFKMFESDLNIMHTKKTYSAKIVRVNKSIAQLVLINGNEKIELMPFSAFSTMSDSITDIIGVRAADVEPGSEQVAEGNYYGIVVLVDNVAKLSLSKTTSPGEYIVTSHPENKYIKLILNYV
jgi:hypothetical protein